MKKTNNDPRKKSDNSTSYNRTNTYHKQPVAKPLTTDAVVPMSSIKKREAEIKANGPKNKLK